MTREHVFGGDRTLSPVRTGHASRTLVRPPARPGGKTEDRPGTVAPRHHESLSAAEDLPSSPGLIQVGDLPGRLSLNLLVRLGIVTVLDPATCYRNDDAEGIFGRASIILPLLPFGAAACGSLALWIWLNGTFPETLDVISNSHFRAPVLGRPLRPHNRKLNPQYLMRLGRLWVTSPLWTACDLACEEQQALSRGEARQERIHELMDRYQVSCSDCLDLLAANPRWPGHATGIKTITGLKAFF